MNRKNDIVMGEETIVVEDYNKYRFTLFEKYKILTIGYVFIFLMSFLFYRSLPFSLIMGFGSVFFMRFVEDVKVKKRKKLLLLQFKDLLYSLSVSVSGGRQLGIALIEAYHNMRAMYDRKTPLMIELSYIKKSIQENRTSEEYLLMDLAERSHLDDIKNFVNVYKACKTGGGNMDVVITNAGEILIEKIEIEREIETLTGQKKFEGKIIMLMPVLVIIFLNLFSPEYIEILYTCVAGRMIMTTAWVGMLLAYILNEKIMNIKV